MAAQLSAEQIGEGVDSVDVVVVGAGFSGLYMLHKLRALGFSARVYEAGGGVGGTWYWNRYPGARVDIESQEYSYSFSPELEAEWEWSERYALQPELLRYLNHVADRFDLRRDIRLDTRVLAATFDEEAGRWSVVTDNGDRVLARFCVMATGCLSTPKAADFPGAASFTGATYSTSDWPHEPVDFTGLRVGVIGTGSSGIQVIPQIAKQAAHLTVFQRTPNFSVPAQNCPAKPELARRWKEHSAQYREQARQSGFGILLVDQSADSALEATPEERRRVYEDRWGKGGFSVVGSFADLIFNKQANDTAVEFIAGKIGSIVKDPVTAETLTPRTYPLATKRICVDTGYYATFNRDNVTLVDVAATPIEEIVPTGVRTSAATYPLDCLVYAIGFDAMTGALTKIDIRGRGGVSLKEKWAEGPRTFLGLMVAGFPNLFTVTGPGSPSVLSNMVLSIEQHVGWIAACISHVAAQGDQVIEATTRAEDDWVAHVNEVANATLFPQANSWYMGANVPGKPRVFMPYIGGVPAYRQKCDEVAAAGYQGCTVSGAGGACEVQGLAAEPQAS
jgi:cyclohexanone monooxygenase